MPMAFSKNEKSYYKLKLKKLDQITKENDNRNRF